MNKIHPCRNYVYFDPNSFKILRITILLLTFAPIGAYTPHPSPQSLSKVSRQSGNSCDWGRHIVSQLVSRWYSISYNGGGRTMPGFPIVPGLRHT